jgi:hypothetical protein
MTIPRQQSSPLRSHVAVRAAQPSRLDWLIRDWHLYAIALLVIVTLGAALMPRAFAATSASSDTQINLTIPISVAVIPGLTRGDRTVNMPELTLPGISKTATSDGWKVSTNWAKGYEVQLASITDPAMQGNNAVDGKGAEGNFSDFGVSGCPCNWAASGTRGVFGYTVEVSTASGPAATGGDKWGTSAQHKWRGLTTGGYQLFATPGGVGEYPFSLKFRSEIPPNGVQPNGSYRANVVLSIVPQM